MKPLIFALIAVVTVVSADKPTVECKLVPDPAAYSIDTCTKHQKAAPGYVYKRFYQIPNDIRNSKPDGFKTRFVVYMEGPSDGNVLLSSTTNLNDPKIEIIIGGMNNNVCNIRDQLGSSDCFVTTQTKNIMDPSKKTKITVEVTDDGYVQIYRGEEKKPFMVWHDKKQVEINYASFSGFGGSAVGFDFSCGP